MLNGWRIKMRQAETAITLGRLEEAARLLRGSDLQERQPARKLQQRLAAQFAERSLTQLAAGEPEEGWRSLEEARQVGGETPLWIAQRREFVQRRFAEVEQRLVVGDPQGARQILDDLEQHRVAGRSVAAFREAARRLQSARLLAARGQFSEADQQLAAAVPLLQPQAEFLETERMQVQAQGKQFRQLDETLHRLLQERAWSEVLRVADELIALAPEYAMASDARAKAWAQVQPSPSPALAATAAGPRANGVPADVRPQSARGLLWVDAVGGFLFCCGEEITLGQALPGNPVDVPLLADVSRKHAMIRRQAGAYILDPLHAVQVDGRPAGGPTLLSDGDEIELGSVVRLRFRQPHALSATARLEFLSPHRTQPASDGVLLLAESCILGPSLQNHVVCRAWSGDVVIFRQDEGLYCRAQEPLEVDGQVISGRARLQPNSRICGSDFSMSLEELDKCTK